MASESESSRNQTVEADRYGNLLDEEPEFCVFPDCGCDLRVPRCPNGWKVDD